MPRPKPKSRPRFPALLGEVRSSLKLTKVALAAQTGVGERSLIRWERGHGLPSREGARKLVAGVAAVNLDQAAALAKSLGFTLAALGVAPPPPPPVVEPPKPTPVDPAALDAAVLRLAERTDARGREMRPAVAAFLAKLDELKLSPADAVAMLSKELRGTSARAMVVS